MVRKILCVAEKASIAKAVANHLAGGNVSVGNITGYKYAKNYEFQYDFGSTWGPCDVVFTSVAGHLQSQDFGQNHRKWNSCDPIQLFDAPIETFVTKELQPIARNIEFQSRNAFGLFIWTDCDREGEHIGKEIRDVALRAKPSLQVKRATFSNIERSHVIQAAQNPTVLDERAAHAVGARMELDLRIGAAFTRLLTLNLTRTAPELDGRLISYGSCQFPTLGFVVDRYWKVQKFLPEQFWKLVLKHEKQGIKVDFDWKRVRVFDRALATLLLERCINKTALVTKVDRRRKTKWRPLPLTTVELQKCGTRFLRMDSKRIMKIAEDLYTKGFISYPRTETDQFDKNIELKPLIQKQAQSDQWGTFAHNLINGGYNTPRSGTNNDKAHPPIHPVNFVAPSALSADEREVYNFVARRFLACCSSDAVGELSTVEILYGGPNSDLNGQNVGTGASATPPFDGEVFTATGLIVLERNYLEVYPFEKWNSSGELPPFVEGERFLPQEANIYEGTTAAPKYLTEPELIGLMDSNGIGTDATMAEHISKIREREYVSARPAKGTGAAATTARGGGRGRGSRGRGRGGRGGGATGADSQDGDGAVAGGAGSGILEFIPTKLGCALIDGYDDLNLDHSLSKPFLRREMEIQLKGICEGRITTASVIDKNLNLYREIYDRSTRNMSVLKGSIRKYFGGGAT